VSYEKRPTDVRVDVVPSFVEGILRALVPRAVEESDFFGRVVGAALRLTPARLALSSAYNRQEDRIWRYDGILTGQVDQSVEALESPREGLQNRASITMQPFESVTAAVSYTSFRDLLDPDRATSRALERDALDEARDQVAGVDLGWERDRLLSSELAVRPLVAPWLRPSLAYSGRFGLQRRPSQLEVEVLGADTVALLQRTFQGERRLSRGVVLEPGGFGRALLGVPGEDDRGPGPALVRAMNAGLGQLLPFDVTWSDGLSSRFERETVRPGTAYQLGLGGPDAFRVIGADTAYSHAVRDGFRARSGLRLPGAAQVEVAYDDGTTTLAYARGGVSGQAEKSWPDVRFTWMNVPVPGRVQDLVSASVSAGFTRTRRVTSIGAGATPVERSTLEHTVPLQLRLGLGTGVSASYSGSLTVGEGSDPTGGTEREASSHALGIGGRFLAPAALRDRFPEPIGISLRYDYRAEQQCRVPPVDQGLDACTPYVDFLSRRMDITVDSYMSQLNVGLQISYTDRRSFVGTRAGNSQFQLALFGQFDFAAGTRGGGR